MSPLRSALLDAAYQAAVGPGWTAARMADVARAAGTSRQTLYAEFGTKDGLAQALALREAARFVDGSEAVLKGHGGTPTQAIAAATEWALRVAREDALIKAALTDGGADGLLPFLTTRSEALLRAVAARNAAYLSECWPSLPAEEVEFLADVLVRLTVSHIVTPAAPADVTAAAIARLVTRLLPGQTAT